MSFSGQIGKHAHRNAIFATMSVAMVVILGTITGLFNASKNVHANVVGFGVEIYWDQDCTNRTLSFDWGSISPDSNKTFTVYIRNESESAAYLSIATSNWAPSAALSYMTLSWNYSGQTLSVGQVIHLGLILAVSPSITGIAHFSFDTTITTTN